MTGCSWSPRMFHTPSPAPSWPACCRPIDDINLPTLDKHSSPLRLPRAHGSAKMALLLHAGSYPMKSLAGILLVVAASGAGPSLGLCGRAVYDVRNYGAAPGGETLCTAAIQKAVNQCAAGGGGTVYFPPGVWLSGTIELRSQVTLTARCRLSPAGQFQFGRLPRCGSRRALP